MASAQHRPIGQSPVNQALLDALIRAERRDGDWIWDELSQAGRERLALQRAAQHNDVLRSYLPEVSAS